MSIAQRAILFAATVLLLGATAAIAASPRPALWYIASRDETCESTWDVNAGVRATCREQAAYDLNLDSTHRLAYAVTFVAVVGGALGLVLFRGPRPRRGPDS